MTTLATGQWTARSHGEAAADATGGRLVAEIVTDFGTAEIVWRGLSASGHSNAYQSFVFCEAYFRHIEGPAGGELAIVILRNDAGTPELLLPLVVQSKGALRVARFIGGKHSNFNMPICAPDAARRNAAGIAAALKAAGRLSRIDAFALHSQPLEWEGFRNPLAGLASTPSPSNGYKLSLERDPDALFKRQMSKDTRRKIRQKAQKLTAMGGFSYQRLTEQSDIEAALAAFFALKAARFASQGITDPFAAPEVRAFLSQMSTPGSAAPIELHALTAAGRIAAIFGCVTDRVRCSALFTAFDSDPALARHSPGDVLLYEMISDCCARGFATFDLGVGEAHYKDKFCDSEEPLFETFLPVSARGRALSLAMRAANAAKRSVKATRIGRRAVSLIRKLTSRARDSQ